MRDPLTRLGVSHSTIADFCRRHHIQQLSFFGSILRDDFRPESDVDVLVEFEPGRAPGWEFFDMETELSSVLGRKVDLNTAGWLSSHWRSEVVQGAYAEYVSA